MTYYPVIVVGGGQAGLSLSYCLKQRGIEHVILEKYKVGHAWTTQRWDSFCLVTPNWQCKLPGYPYVGNTPHGFMTRDEILSYVRGYSAFFRPPVQEGVEVLSLRSLSRSRSASEAPFHLTTSQGELSAHQVVVATGAYHRAAMPSFAGALPSHILQLHSSDYRNPASLPEGAVLVVGTGQSGCQIAEDLHLAGRKVHLAVGNAPRCARRYRGKDIVEWLDIMGYYDIPLERHPHREQLRGHSNHYMSGRDGGADIDLRRFAAEGMHLYGSVAGVQEGRLRFVPDLKKNLDYADEVYRSVNRSIDEYIEQRRLRAPEGDEYVPVWEPDHEPESLDLQDGSITSVIWCTGFSADFGWVDIPVFDDNGLPQHRRGRTEVPGLYFLGLPWLHSWGSSWLSGVGRDAEYLAGFIHEYHDQQRVRPLLSVAND